MISNGPSRTFTREAVEVWLHRLSTSDWEKNFEINLLKEAQVYYRNGLLSALDIQEEQLIITKKIDREETYSVVEWKNLKPEIRTSLDDEKLGQILATAGLYEVEELIAEIQEEEPLFGESNAVESLPKIEKKDKERTCEDPQETLFSQPKVELVVFLEISPKKGLTATPKWKLAEGNFAFAYGTSAEFFSNSDRPALMKFVAEANGNGFSFNKKSGEFKLSDWSKIAILCEKQLKQWEDCFELKFEGEAGLLKNGQRKLHWEIQARCKNKNSMTLLESFHIGSHRLGRQSVRRISNARIGITFIRGHGLVKMDHKQLDDFDWWQRNKGDATRTSWPNYMLFSLFARKYLKTRPDGKLANWQSSIRKLKPLGLEKKFAFLRPYQLQGVSQIFTLHSMGCHALLADEMGLGKTIQSLALLASSGKQKIPDLVVCPASVVQVWLKEAKDKFPSLKVKVLNKENSFEMDDDGSFLWIASYTQLRRHRHLLEGVTFKHAILDEAQLIKNPKAKITQACLSIKAKNRLALSGTPIENKALDLWTIFRFLMPGLLGGRKEFEQKFLEDSHKSALLTRRQVNPFVLRRLKSEVAKELPPKIEMELPCQLSDEQKKEYRKLTDHAIARHGGDLKGAISHSPTHVFSLLTRLRQVCCDLSLLPGKEHLPTHGIKSDLLIEKLKDLSPAGMKVLVFSQFTSFLSILKKRIRLEIPELKVHELTGSTRDRRLPVESFENETEATILLASLKAAGLGVTLNSADYVFLMDPWWNPAVEDQAIDRAHRIGKQKPTFIYRIVAKGTVEDRVRQLQQSKKETFDEIIGELDSSGNLTKHFRSLKELVEFNEN